MDWPLPAYGRRAGPCAGTSFMIKSTMSTPEMDQYRSRMAYYGLASWIALFDFQFRFASPIDLVDVNAPKTFPNKCCPELCHQNVKHV